MQFQRYVPVSPIDAKKRSSSADSKVTKECFGKGYSLKVYNRFFFIKQASCKCYQSGFRKADSCCDLFKT